MTRWKRQPVVVALAGPAGVVAVVLGALGQTDEVRHGLGRVVREQVDRDVAPVGLQDGLLVSHVCLSRVGSWCVPILPRTTTPSPTARVRGRGRPVGYGADMMGWDDETRGRSAMGIRRNKTILEQAADYVDAVVEAASEKAGPAIADAIDKAGPMLADAKDKAGPALADAKDKAGPALADARRRALAAGVAPQASNAPTWRREKARRAAGRDQGRAEEEAHASASS